MTDLDYYDYKLITEFDWITFLIMLAFPSAFYIPILLLMISAVSNELLMLYEIEGIVLMGIIGYGMFAIVGYFFARGCPKCVKTVEQVEQLPTFGQKKKVLK